MILDFQQEQRLLQQSRAPAAVCFATVLGVFEDGLTLLFDGEEKARQKHYPCNAAVAFSVGQRVRVDKAGGFYIAAYPIKGGGA